MGVGEGTGHPFNPLFILSIKAAINTPAARKNTLIRQEAVEARKLSKGIVMKVAATTVPTIA